MKRINLKEYMYSFFVFFIFILLCGMALKNKNKTLCGYDLVLCCTTYAYITIIPITPVKAIPITTFAVLIPSEVEGYNIRIGI